MFLQSSLTVSNPTNQSFNFGDIENDSNNMLYILCLSVFHFIHLLKLKPKFIVQMSQTVLREPFMLMNKHIFPYISERNIYSEHKPNSAYLIYSYEVERYM